VQPEPTEIKKKTAKILTKMDVSSCLITVSKIIIEVVAGLVRKLKKFLANLVQPIPGLFLGNAQLLYQLIESRTADSQFSCSGGDLT
jgi:hypothetical protein